MGTFNLYKKRILWAASMGCLMFGAGLAGYPYFLSAIETPTSIEIVSTTVNGHMAHRLAWSAAAFLAGALVGLAASGQDCRHRRLKTAAWLTLVAMATMVCWSVFQVQKTESLLASFGTGPFAPSVFPISNIPANESGLVASGVVGLFWLLGERRKRSSAAKASVS